MQLGPGGSHRCGFFSLTEGRCKGFSLLYIFWVMLFSLPSCDLEQQRASVCELECFVGDAYQLSRICANDLRFDD